MAVLLTSGPRTGLSALGGGGWTASGSYDQITRFLRRTLSPEHALLFAEPSERPGIVDWYTDAPHEQAPARFVEARPEHREKIRGVLGRLVDEITASADSLGTSDRQSDRITGEMLRLALEIPDESSVWIVGEQPVLVFWGHHQEVAARTPNPLFGLIARRASASAGPARIPAIRNAAAAPAAVSGSAPAIGSAGRAARTRWLLPGLWAIFALLLLSIGLLLLRGCALGLPAALTGWFVDFCPVREAVAGPDPRLAAERARQASLQAELDGLQRDAALKRQYCELRAPTPEPDPKPPPKQELKPKPPIDAGPVIPTEVNPEKPFDYLAGCWIAGENLVSTEDKQEKFPYTYKLCVDDQGGGQVVREFVDGRTCRGPARVRQSDDRSLNFEISESNCPRGPFQNFSRNRIFCNRQPDGVASCVMKRENLPDVALKLKRGPPAAP